MNSKTFITNSFFLFIFFLASISTYAQIPPTAQPKKDSTKTATTPPKTTPKSDEVIVIDDVTIVQDSIPTTSKKDSLKTTTIPSIIEKSNEVIDDTNPIAQDSVPTLPYSFSNTQYGSLFLDNISKFEVIYDAETRQYMFVEKMGEYYIKHPFYMNKKEYEDYRLQRDMLDYFKEKLSAVSGNKKNSAEAQKNLLPKYHVKNKFFEGIFGGNTIEVNPQGSVLVKMGMLYQKVENPQLSERNRQSTTFDFDQEISASLNAKVGTRLRVNANFDTQSTFNFQNLIKLEYTPTEDDIVQKIEVGNVSMPLQSSLISGAQNLFGFKTQLQFGKTTVTGVFSQQRSQTRSVAAEGGATINEFELRASDYDDNRHFFLSQRFRDDYNNALSKLPLINSSKNITRIEIWVTNRNNTTQEVRNIVALADLGERDATNINSNLVTPATGNDPSNEANTLNAFLTPTNGVREISTVNTALAGYAQGTDYSILENARKLTLGVDFTLNPQLGYITLNRRLSESDILAVAYEYTDANITAGENVFRVGELSSDGVTAPQNLVVKLLRSEINNTQIPMWDLMMKNVYALPGAYQLQPDGFRIEILYQDDATGVPLNILQNANTLISGSDEIKTASLLRMMRLDRLDATNQETTISGSFNEGDGFFDYIEGVTIDSQNGYIIFPTVEPFGTSVEDPNKQSGSGELGQILTNALDNKYVFSELYDRTKSQAQNNFQKKDKYFLKGYFKSESQSGIPLGAFNVPKGSVTVTSGGRELLEGVDYVVDYQIGSVQIIDPNLLASNAPINVSVENNNGFSQQRRNFIGIDVQHVFDENFAIGGTVVNLKEKPFTQKYQFGSEPVNNTIIGFNLNYQTEVPKFTKWVNKLPNIDTDAISNFSVRAEAAYLLPSSPKGINLNGEAASYVDDFEGSQIPLDISSPRQWFLASVPEHQPSLQLAGGNAPLDFGKNRAKLAWYNIDRLFYGNQLKPSNIDDVELSRAEVRRVSFNELFPELDLDITQVNIVNTLDLAYYPQERGSYNYDTANLDANGKFTNPQERWAGIMRSLNTTDFQQANIEYIQFWLLDPFENYSIKPEEGGLSTPLTDADKIGELYFNLGNISEDILNDNRRMYENGMPADGNIIKSPDVGANVDETATGFVPKNQSLLYAFTEKDSERPNQDVGLDGLTDTQEITKFGAQFGDDPSNDNYNYFRGGDLDAADASILTRYRNFNRTQGNSPTIGNSKESFPTSATSFPDVEDINKDQTMSDVESYYQYKVDISPSSLVVGQNNIVDRKVLSVSLPNGTTQQATWYQFRIPVNSPDENINNISDFNSIRFMRMFLTKFKVPVVLRFGKLELVRGDWRRYVKTLDENINPPIDLTEDENRGFEVGVVNIQENERKEPIPYILPPGVRRERLQGSTTIQEQNEQSLLIRVNDLEPNETRAVFKNTRFDMRMFNKLNMFIHAESIVGKLDVNDDEMVAVLRLGSDTDDNFYQIEVPLKITATSASTEEEIWPSENNLNTNLKGFGALKLERLDNGASLVDLFPSIAANPDAKIRVKGNPNLSNIRTIMLGVKNASNTPKSVEVWYNELRVTDFDNEGGWAAVLNADANFADFADISMSGRANSKGFGSVDQRVNERSIEDVKQYDIVTNINLGQLLPKKVGIQLPLNLAYAEEFRDPKWDPQYQDILFDKNNSNADAARDYTKRRSLNLINVRKERTNTEKKQHFYDVENLSVSYAYSDTYHKDYNVEKFVDQNVRASATYNYSFKPKPYEPFKKSKFLEKNAVFKFIKDFNINYLPTSLSVNSNIIRSFNQQLSRPLVEDPSFPDLPTLTQKRFMFDWDYNISHDLTKSLQFTFRASNNYVNDILSADKDVTLFTDFLKIGRSNHYHQALNATYKIPINNIPLFDFVNANYSYTADFDWQAASASYVADIGNTIQNANTHTFSADLDMTKFYKKTGIQNLYKKKIKASKAAKGKAKNKKNKNKGKKNTTKGENDETKDDDAKEKKAKKIKRPKTKYQKISRKKMSTGKKIVQGLVDAVTSVKKIKIAYSENNGTTLPGYVPEVGFLGRNNFHGGLAPTLGFVFGNQRDIRGLAVANKWLVSRSTANNESYFSKNYSSTHLSKLDLNADVKPFKNFNIELSATRVFSSNQSQQIDVTDGVLNDELPISEMGNFSISYFMLPNAFDGDGDATFRKFKANRAIIANRLKAQANLSGSDTGFGENSQQVLLPAFLAAYSGKSARGVKLGAFRNFPIPNWRINYKGFMKFKWFKKRFRSFNVEHRYRSMYSIIGFSNNLLYKPATGSDPNAPYSNPDINGNYQPDKLYTGINLIEEFSPLIKVDVRMKNSLSFKAEIRRDKTLNLDMNNNTITEIRGKEYIIGLGYRIKDVKLKMKMGDSTKRFKGDINIKADFGIRDDATIIRSIDIENNQVTGGQRLLSYTVKADYAMNKNFLASFYYDYNSSRFLISTTFPRKSLSAGISFRYIIGN